MYNNNEEDRLLAEPPRYDTLSLKFRGDSYEIVLPYIEVANGDIVSISGTEVEIMLIKDNVQDAVKMTYTDFTKLIETTFDTKEIVELKLQLAGTYDRVTIL
jgi:hypothetical protein